MKNIIFYIFLGFYIINVLIDYDDQIVSSSGVVMPIDTVSIFLNFFYNCHDIKYRGSKIPVTIYVIIKILFLLILHFLSSENNAVYEIITSDIFEDRKSTFQVRIFLLKYCI